MYIYIYTIDIIGIIYIIILRINMCIDSIIFTHSIIIKQCDLCHDINPAGRPRCQLST